MSSPISRFNRVNQWLLFARQWHVIDAAHQDVQMLGQKVATHLAGKHKPIWHPETDCGDHVVVVNCKDAAMHGFDWKHTLYHYDKMYPKARADFQAWQIHEFDPCRIVWMSIYRRLGTNLDRRTFVERLHLFPDEDMPQFVKKNIGSQLRQVLPVPKKLPEYTSQAMLCTLRPFVTFYRSALTPCSSSTMIQISKFCEVTLSQMEYEAKAEETLQKLTGYLDTLPDWLDTHPDYDINYAMGVLTAKISPKVGTYGTIGSIISGYIDMMANHYTDY